MASSRLLRSLYLLIFRLLAQPFEAKRAGMCDGNVAEVWPRASVLGQVWSLVVDIVIGPSLCDGDDSILV